MLKLEKNVRVVSYNPGVSFLLVFNVKRLYFLKIRILREKTIKVPPLHSNISRVQPLRLRTGHEHCPCDRR
jgi:hypothetical protein